MGSPNSEIKGWCKQRLPQLRIAGRPEVFALFVLFVQEGPDRRSSGFTEECHTSLLPYQARDVVHSLEGPSRQQGVRSAFSQAGNPSLSAITLVI